MLLDFSGVGNHFSVLLAGSLMLWKWGKCSHQAHQRETLRSFSSGRERAEWFSVLCLSLSARGRAHRHVTHGGKGYLCVYHFPGILKCPLPLASHLLLLSISVKDRCDSKTITRNSVIQFQVQRNSWIGRILEDIKLAAWISSISCGWVSNQWGVMLGSSETWVDKSQHVLLWLFLFSKSFTSLCLLLLSTQTDTNTAFPSLPSLFFQTFLVIRVETQKFKKKPSI